MVSKLTEIKLLALANNCALDPSSHVADSLLALEGGLELNTVWEPNPDNGFGVSALPGLLFLRSHLCRLESSVLLGLALALLAVH